MTTGMEQPSRGRAPRVIAFALFALLALCLPGAASAQWATSGNNISNTNTGNVGVGTPTPQAKLDVQGSSTYATGGIFSAIYAKGTADYPMALMLDGAGTSDNIARLRALNNGATRWQLNFGDDLIFYRWTNTFLDTLALRNNGNVGIGTSAPSARLQVSGAGPYAAPGAAEFRLQNTAWNGSFTQHLGDTGTWQLADATTGATKIAVNPGINGAINLFNGAGNVVINGTGNVGIGAASPGARLDVGVGSSARGSYSDVLIGAGGNNSQLEFYGPTRSSAITHDEAMGGMIFYTNGPTWSPSMTVSNAGNVGVGTTAPAARLHVAGDIRVDGNINAKYQDVAEWVPSVQKLAAGTVVILDPERPNHVLASSASYDTAVAGVISARPGLSLGEAGEGKALVATTGRVKVRVDATRAPIRIGDLLVTSDVAGVAMKSEPVVMGGRRMHAPGTIIGKALEPLASGTGEILVLLSLQ